MKRFIQTLGLGFFVLLLWHGGAAFAAASPRIALVIGNSAYKIAPPLPNPANDARLMAETLRSLGFEVIERIDADRETMLLAVFELQDRLIAAGKDAVGLFFYAGHGVQVSGENYFIPLKTEIKQEREVSIKAVSASFVLKQMEFADNSSNFVILDACRNNPFPTSTRATTRGLARMNAPSGSLVAYSTGPGEVAADGVGDNSPYVLALIEAMQLPGVPAELMFKRVRERVLVATNDEQTPWEESSLKGGDFYFTATELVTAAASDTSTSNYNAATTQQESLFWRSIKDTTEVELFEAYLAQYPEGTFAALARFRIKQFGGQQAAAEAKRLAAEEEARRQAEAESQRLAAEEEARRLAEAEAQRLAAEEEARRRAEAEAQRLAAEEEARRLAEAEARRLAAEEVALRQAEVEALRLAVEEETRRLAEIKRLAAEEETRRLAEAEAQREETEPTTQGETLTALLAVPPESSIVIDKAEVENDDRLKAVIEKYFKARAFMNKFQRRIEIVSFIDLSVKFISGTTFTVDIEYEQSDGFISRARKNTVVIEKTAESYKVISFDRER